MKRFLKILFPVLTFLAMLFILYNSASPGEKTVETTSDIAGIIEEQIQHVTDEPVSVTDEQKVMISKVGHLLEYIAFSLFLSLSVFVLGGDVEKMAFHVLLCVVFLALADEQLQIVSADRGSRVSDVIIDLAGGMIGYGAARILCFLRKRREKK